MSIINSLAVKCKNKVFGIRLFLSVYKKTKKLSDIMEDLETEGIKILEKLAEKEKIINVAEHISEISNSGTNLR